MLASITFALSLRINIFYRDWRVQTFIITEMYTNSISTQAICSNTHTPFPLVQFPLNQYLYHSYCNVHMRKYCSRSRVDCCVCVCAWLCWKLVFFIIIVNSYLPWYFIFYFNQYLRFPCGCSQSICRLYCCII